MMTQAWWKSPMNKTRLPDELWYVYMIYLNGYEQNLRESVRVYEERPKGIDTLAQLIPPYKEEIEGMEFIKRYLNE
ncbi:hypothetical protein LCGC14_1364870 [marine sediment metagenome]|uniref:Uncharacterized protein n=1 Tax=marine sediment metagenome TaxID=412755 RepID=A0A0F9N964_9ZZZZ